MTVRKLLETPIQIFVLYGKDYKSIDSVGEENYKVHVACVNEYIFIFLEGRKYVYICYVAQNIIENPLVSSKF